MSGPVWRFEKCEGCICDECLRQIDAAYVQGIVKDGEFHRSRILCEDCYRANLDVISKQQTQDH